MSYDPHREDGIGNVRTFNVKAQGGAKGGFGSMIPRRHHDVKETPGPGDYVKADPNAPTVDSKLNSNRGKVTGAFASTTLRDTSSWAMTGALGRFER